MVFDLDMLHRFYDDYPKRIARIREVMKRPLTLAEKILYAHLYDLSSITEYRRGMDYADFRPDRVAMQDATAQMALLQFMNAGRCETAVPATVHCDHLIKASEGAAADLAAACSVNAEVLSLIHISEPTRLL